MLQSKLKKAMFICLNRNDSHKKEVMQSVLPVCISLMAVSLSGDEYSFSGPSGGDIEEETSISPGGGMGKPPPPGIIMDIGS